jgi:hypothetical protein
VEKLRQVAKQANINLPAAATTAAEWDDFSDGGGDGEGSRESGEAGVLRGGAVYKSNAPVGDYPLPSAADVD